MFCLVTLPPQLLIILIKTAHWFLWLCTITSLFLPVSVLVISSLARGQSGTTGQHDNKTGMVIKKWCTLFCAADFPAEWHSGPFSYSKWVHICCKPETRNMSGSVLCCHDNLQPPIVLAGLSWGLTALFTVSLMWWFPSLWSSDTHIQLYIVGTNFITTFVKCPKLSYNAFYYLFLSCFSSFLAQIT